MTHAYAYILTHKTTGEFYIGSRWNNKRFHRTPEDDFLVHYFTSGSLKTRIKEHPDEFVGEILFTFEDEDVVYWYEQLLIREAIADKKCMNRHFIDPDSDAQMFRSNQWTEERKNKLRKPKPSGFSEKLREANLGKKHNNATKEKLRQANLGKTQTTDTKEKRKRSMSALVWINNGTTNKRVDKALVVEFLKQGWINGRIGKSNQYQ